MTVEHLYTIHSYILSVGAIALCVIHLGGLLLQEREAKHLQRDLAEILSVSEVSEPQTSVVTRSSGR